MKILLTAFEPFGGSTINPTENILNKLSDEFIKLKLPVSFIRAAAQIKAAIEKEQPDFVVCMGLASGESQVRVEKLAINYEHARIADNDGDRPQNRKVNENGENALFSLLNVEKLVDLFNNTVKLSLSAGSFVCNATYYVALKEMHGKAIFIHVPNSPELGDPSLPINDMLSTVQKIVDFVKSEAML